MGAYEIVFCWGSGNLWFFVKFHIVKCSMFIICLGCMDYHPKGKMVLSGAVPHPGGHARIQTDLHAANAVFLSTQESLIV